MRALGHAGARLLALLGRTRESARWWAAEEGERLAGLVSFSPLFICFLLSYSFSLLSV
jgi:hypothetical protein